MPLQSLPPDRRTRRDAAGRFTLPLGGYVGLWLVFSTATQTKPNSAGMTMAAQHWRRWLIFMAVFVGVAALLLWREHVRHIREQNLAHAIQRKGGQVHFGPSAIDSLRASWWGIPVWQTGTSVMLLGDRPYDSGWLQGHDHLANLRIAYLYLNGSLIKTEDAERLIKRHPLRRYSGNGQQSADAIAAALSDKPRLTHVALFQSDLTDDGLRSLPLEQLEYLDVKGTRVTADGLHELHRCRRLAGIDLDGQQLDDAVLTTLAGLPALDRVRLVGPDVNDDNVRMVAVLQKLPSLDLESTSVTDAGAEKLSLAMPATVIGRE